MSSCARRSWRRRLRFLLRSDRSAPTDTHGLLDAPRATANNERCEQIDFDNSQTLGRSASRGAASQPGSGSAVRLAGERRRLDTTGLPLPLFRVGRATPHLISADLRRSDPDRARYDSRGRSLSLREPHQSRAVVATVFPCHAVPTVDFPNYRSIKSGPVFSLQLQLPV